MQAAFSYAELEKLLGRHGFRIDDWLAPCNIQTRIIESAGANLKAFEHVNYCLCPACWYNVIDETKIVSSKTVIWLCRFPKHSNIEVLTGAESGKTACLVSIQELLTA